jgi:succinyl-CoA synthetase alpha subunit
MSILVNKKNRVLVQGITGREGLFHTQQMVLSKTNIVAGVSPGHGGEWVLDGKIPVFDSVIVGKEVSGADTSVIFVPARHATDAMYEAADAGISLIVCITEGIPVQEMMTVCSYLKQKNIRLIGPNCPGIITPGEGKVGIIPADITFPGHIGVVSRSGTLTYEVLYALKKAGMGTSTCVGIGGDPICGSSFVDILELFESDPYTEKIVIIGEIGGNDEERAAQYIARNITKPVVAFIAGHSAPAGKKMGHAGAIIEGITGYANEKIASLQTVGVRIAQHPEAIPELLIE